MFEAAYARFDVRRPPHLAAEYWLSVEAELLRLARSPDAADDVQVIGDAKCLVEAVAKIVWDINGTPPDSNDGFQKVVARAHELLRNQPGHELAHGTTFAIWRCRRRRWPGTWRRSETRLVAGMVGLVSRM